MKQSDFEGISLLNTMEEHFNNSVKAVKDDFGSQKKYHARTIPSREGTTMTRNIDPHIPKPRRLTALALVR